MALRFNGTAGSKARVTTGCPTFAAFTIVLVGKPASIAAGFKTWLGGGADTGSNPCFGVQQNAAALEFFTYAGLLATSALTLTTANTYGIAITSNGGGTTVNGVKFYSRLLTPLGTTDVKTTAWPLASFTGTLASVIMGDSHFSEPMNGDLESILIYDRVMSQAEVEQSWDERRPVGANNLRWAPLSGTTLAAVYDDLVHATDWATVGTAPVAATELFVDCYQSVTFANMTSAGTATVDVTGASATTLADMTSSGAATVDVTGASATTFADMTSAGTATVDVTATQTKTLDDMTSVATGTVAAGDINASQDLTFGDMTSAGVATIDITAAQAITFADMTSAADATTGGGPAAVEVPYTFANTPQRILVRLDGRLHEVSYSDAAELLARQAKADAADRAERSRAAAKKAARLAAQGLRGRLTIEEPLAFPGIDMAVVADRMFKDLRDVYSQQLIQSLLAADVARRQSDDQAAMAAAELLLME